MSKDKDELRLNGYDSCPLRDWKERLVPELSDAIYKVDIMHNNMLEVNENTKHLSKLSDIQTTLQSMNTNLVSAATGAKHVPFTSHILMLICMALIITALIVERWNADVSIGADGIKMRRNTPAGATSERTDAQ